MECPICIEQIEENKEFKCFSCNCICCISCMKTYLLDKSEDPHCLNCRAAVGYDQFMNKFDLKWRLGIYKKHKEEILMDKEKALMPLTVGYLDRLNQIEALKNKKADLARQMFELDQQINTLMGNVKKEVVTKYEWTQACPSKDCRGYLNSSNECAVCQKKYCKQCFEEKKEGHECDKDLVETMKLIKKESKPCPKCGEFISKISGCDQMFCTSCGTAFSWKSGQIEKGIIHNPHAHQFFQNNPDAYEMYMNNRDVPAGGAGNVACRDLVPRMMDYKKFVDKNKLPKDVLNMVIEYRRNVSEYNQYRQTPIENELISIDKNQDLRIRYLKNELDEKHFKTMLHMRNKRYLFRQQIHEVVVSTKIIFGNLLWNINEVDNMDNFMKIFKMFEDLRISTNQILLRISEEHGYKAKVEFSERLSFPQY